MKKKNLLFFFICVFISISSKLYSAPLVFTGVKERKFTQDRLSYILHADRRTIDYKQLRKIKFFNRKKIVSQALYYNNGTFFQKDLKIDFQRGYFYEGDFYMNDCYSTIENGYIQAKSAVYKKKYIEYKDLVMKQDNKKYHKRKYRIMLP